MIGRTLSHYRIEEEISRGGMGIVYRAVDTRLERAVALKVLPPELVGDPDRRERFVQEAKAASQLSHPHIAVIHEIDEAEGVTFIAMELVAGEKLSHVLEAGRLGPARTLELATEVAEGLALAHERRIVHRDLKPANVMVTTEGHAKIIDFGLAKLLPPLGGGSGETETALKGRTAPGIVMGTVAYMSPEQARGAAVDARSDVFSFGVLLYEMLTGTAPFRAASGIEILNAILRDQPPPLSAETTEAPSEVVPELQRIVDKCLAKDPADRYQTMKDVVVDLRAVRRRLESGAVSRVPAPRRRRLSPRVAAVLGLVLAGAAVAFFAVRGRDEATPSGRATPGRPSIAVLYFDNVSGDPSLDWLRAGLAEMLVTDLAQSPGLEVLGTDRLHQILGELHRRDERVTSVELVREVASRTGVGTVLLGSFMKAGDQIRINIRIQEAGSGRILASDKVEGTGEEAVFPMVDELTARIQSRLAVPKNVLAGLDRGLEEVTTSSLEAYRHYVEGMRLHYQMKETEAIPHFERAVAIDPDFALAFGRLSAIHSNLGHEAEARRAAARALELADRLPANERYYIEGQYYGQKLATMGKAIDALTRAVELYPHHEAARNNLAFYLWIAGRPADAARHAEELRRRGARFPAHYSILADALVELGREAEADPVIEELRERFAGEAIAERYAGFHFIVRGRYDEAEAAFRREQKLDPDSHWADFGLAQIALLRRDPSAAQAHVNALREAPSPFFRHFGGMLGAVEALQRGRSRDALAALERAAAAFADPGGATAQAEAYRAHVLYERGDIREALEAAEAARAAGRDDRGEYVALYWLALCRERLGEPVEADRLAAELREKAALVPSDQERRRYHHLMGELALVRGDVARAVAELEQAASLLSARGVFGPAGLLPHVPIWYALARGELAAGRDANAERWLRRIVDARTESLQWPIYQVRSLELLGRLYERRGEPARAREYYRRFVESWGEGDLDRDRIARALERL